MSPSNIERIEKVTSEVPLLNAEQKEVMSIIDGNTYKTPLSVSSVVDIIGVVSGIKPTAITHENNISAELVNALGLNTVPLDETGWFATSRDKDLNKVLMDLHQKRELEERGFDADEHVEVGQLLGYPKTATDYFLKRSASFATGDRLPVVIKRAGEGTATEFMTQFILSPDNHQAEIDAYITPLEAAVKELAPETYAFIQNEASKSKKIDVWKDATKTTLYVD